MAAYLYTVHTLPAGGSVPAVYVQPILQVHWIYTACTLHFGLGEYIYNSCTSMHYETTVQNKVLNME